MTKPFYITTPIYYVNDRPHIGHAYTTIAADLMTRFHRLAGREAFFLTGTDEHGTKIAEAAATAGISEIAFCDRTVQTFLTAWKNLSIEYNYFIRTTSEKHIKGVNKILEALRTAKTPDGKEAIYVDYYEGLYCTGCERFYTEKELVNGLCPFHRTKPEVLKEKNYFFRLSSYLPVIKEKILKGELVILPEERRREVLGMIEVGVPDFSASRERVKWGIPLPFDPAQAAYVWVDALSNYITALGYADDPAHFDKWWTNGHAVHFMAKDILKFHTLFWPAMLMAAGVKLPDEIFIHGFFTVDGEKMSKSLGNFIDPNDMVDEFGPDGTRYLLVTQFPFGLDGDIQASRFVAQYNSDLANDLGNLVSRVTKIIETNFDGKLPERDDSAPGFAALKQQADATADAAYAHINAFRIGHAISESMTLVKAANKFFNDAAPWVLVKEGKLKEAGGVLTACCEVIRIVSVLLSPVIPNKAREIRSAFGLTDSGLTLADAKQFYKLAPGIQVKLSSAVFPRLEAKAKAAAPQAKTEVTTSPDESGAGLIDISQFGVVDLRVAKVLEAEKVEGATKLLKLQIDLGTEKRQIISGIAEFYTPEQIQGMNIIVVANLKPAVIRGIQSNGMLLAAKSGKSLVLVSPSADIPVGAKVG